MHSKQDPDNESVDDLDTNSGDYYIGGFKKCGEFYKPWGKGVLLYKNGNFYEGYFEKGLPNGQGRMIVIEMVSSIDVYLLKLCKLSFIV